MVSSLLHGPRQNSSGSVDCACRLKLSGDRDFIARKMLVVAQSLRSSRSQTNRAAPRSRAPAVKSWKCIETGDRSAASCGFNPRPPPAAGQQPRSCVGPGDAEKIAYANYEGCICKLLGRVHILAYARVGQTLCNDHQDPFPYARNKNDLRESRMPKTIQRAVGPHIAKVEFICNFSALRKTSRRVPQLYDEAAASSGLRVT